ncbi:MAG: glycoside hydrolase family 99-like domain-containing protein [Christensenellales bacterium]
MRIIAFYLPQFHSIPENDKWWGEGFTEWTTVRKAKPLFYGHNQPRVPFNENYYNLLDNRVKEWQINLAREHGIHGFCYYHYWFDGHLLLEKPMEQMLQDTTLDFPFCICWANEHWTKAWEGKSNQVLIAQRYGDKAEWKKHFDYLLPFLKDERYIRVEGKPIFVVYRPEIINCCNEMLDYWQQLSRDSGLPGISFAYQQIMLDIENGDDSRFDYNIEYQPNYANYDLHCKQNQLMKLIKRKASRLLDRLGFNVEQIRPGGLMMTDYDRVWDAILSHKPRNSKCIPGAFVDWDNTPRKSSKGSAFIGASPEKFGKYMTKQIGRAKTVYNTDLLFLFAWNEWSEGGYMEPDTKHEFGYLEALKAAIIEQGSAID